MSMPETLWARKSKLPLEYIGAFGFWIEKQVDGGTPYRRQDPDLLIISREELEGMRHEKEKGMGCPVWRDGFTDAIDQLLERIGK